MNLIGNRKHSIWEFGSIRLECTVRGPAVGPTVI